MNNISVYNSDCVAGMQAYVPDNSIDLIFTDPPYGIEGEKLDVHYIREKKFVVEGYIDVPLKKYADFSLNWIKECERVLRPGGSIYIVSGYTNLHHVLNALHSTELYEINHIIAQYSFGVSTTKKFVPSHYHILFWSKKETKNLKRTFNTYYKFSDQKDSYRDRLSVQPLMRKYKPNQMKNKNQLSEIFIEKFIQYSSNRGDIVLDCFAGSMSTGIAALRHGRKFIGFELNKNAYEFFSPLLNDIKEITPKLAEKPSIVELEKRNKMRNSWKKTRMARKNPNNSLLGLIK